jgi:hemolysin III
VSISLESPATIKPLWRGRLHFGGFFVFLACSPILFVRTQSPEQVAWVLCYLVGVGSMMATSASFHIVNWGPVGRERMKRADHSAIFLAIGGSYLAIAGLTMHGNIRLVLLLIIGLSAIVGITIRQLALHASKWVNTIPYLLVGWAAVVVMPQIYRGGGPVCFALIIAGGLAYSIGAVAYGAKRPKLSPRVFGYHELFHAFTIIGAGCHFAAIAVALR